MRSRLLIGMSGASAATGACPAWAGIGKASSALRITPAAEVDKS